MPRSIEEIQRDLEQTDQNLNSIARQTQRIDRGLQVLDEQEKNVPAEHWRLPRSRTNECSREIHGSVDAIESSVAVMEEEMRKRCIVNAQGLYARVTDRCRKYKSVYPGHEQAFRAC